MLREREKCKNLQYRAGSPSAQSYRGQASTEDSTNPQGCVGYAWRTGASVRRTGKLELSVGIRREEGRRPHTRVKYS